jgi:hypothetical protein
MLSSRELSSENMAPEAVHGIQRLYIHRGIDGTFRPLWLEKGRRVNKNTSLGTCVASNSGKQWLGVTWGVSDFAFLSIGTGIGTGLVLGTRTPEPLLSSGAGSPSPLEVASRLPGGEG